MSKIIRIWDTIVIAVPLNLDKTFGIRLTIGVPALLLMRRSIQTSMSVLGQAA